ALHRVGDLFAAAVAHGDDELVRAVLPRLCLDAGDRVLRRLRQKLKATDSPDAPLRGARLGAAELLNLLFDHGEDGVELFRVAVEVAGGERPDGDDGDTEVVAPVDEVLRAIGADTMPLGDGHEAGFAGETAVAIQHDADMVRHLTRAHGV